MSKQCMNYIEKAVELQKQANKVIEDLQIKG